MVTASPRQGGGPRFISQNGLHDTLFVVQFSFCPTHKRMYTLNRGWLHLCCTISKRKEHKAGSSCEKSCLLLNFTNEVVFWDAIWRVLMV